MSSPVFHSCSSIWALPRIPALLFLCCFAAGILLDRLLNSASGTVTLFSWLGLQSGLLLCWGWLHRLRKNGSTGVLLLLVMVTGAAWHHLQWQVLPAHHWRQYLQNAPEPVDVRLRVLTMPMTSEVTLPRYTSARPREQSVQFLGEALGFTTAGKFMPVTGQVQVSVTGAELPIQPGDQVRVLGMARRLTPPRNPAMYNYAETMQRKQVYLSLSCSSVSAVTLLNQRELSAGKRVVHWWSGVRENVRQTYARYLSPQAATLATALILGDRQELAPETRLAFQYSGLTHLLAISGMHVVLIGWLSFGIGRLLNFSQRSLCWFTLAGMTLCLALAGMQPPVFRAWLLGVVIVLGDRTKRVITAGQSLTICGILVLIVNPTWLFDPGAQLSFLAILGILWARHLFPLQFQNQHNSPFTSGLFPTVIETKKRFWLAAACNAVLKVARQSLLISLVITVLMLPLLGYYFQRITWTGIPATALSLPIMTLVVGFLLLLAGVAPLWATLAEGIAAVAEFLLLALHFLASRFADFSWLTWNSLRPPLWLVLSGYGALCLYLLWNWQRRRKMARAALFFWTVGLIFVFEGSAIWSRTTADVLECRILSIGHGNACLLKCPNGRTLLLDAGSMENGAYAAQVIRASLADMQAERLDAILISHTDLDHLNAIPFLLQEFPVQQILLNPVGLTPKHSGMLAVIETAFARNIPLRVLQPEDRLPLDSNLEMQVLQGFTSPLENPGNDNAASLVVSVEAFGCSLLFPGDISGTGLQQLLQKPPRKTDILLAPHHGGRKENTPDFANWANARVVVVSAGFSFQPATLEAVYSPETPLLLTSQGALRCRVSRDHHYQIEQWQPGQYWQPVFSSR